jgi:prevent-host-death family protein
MKTISVGELRQNPSDALAEVERGETYVVTRYRREIARLVPPSDYRKPVTAADAERLFRETPVDAEWAKELARLRAEDVWEDPWERYEKQ